MARKRRSTAISVHGASDVVIRHNYVEGCDVGLSVDKSDIVAEDLTFKNVGLPLEIGEDVDIRASGVKATKSALPRPAPEPRRRVWSVPKLPWHQD